MRNEYDFEGLQGRPNPYRDRLVGELAGTSWSPDQYLKFSDHRLRPALELLQRIPLEGPGVVFDLGCGTGHITRMLAQRWPDAQIHGLDNSAEMITKASAEPSNIHWVQADVEDWSPAEPPDLIYSNATLHWVPDHHTQFPRLFETLKPGGCLALQMPLSWAAPSHRLMRESLADGGPGGSPLGSEELRRAVARKWVEDTHVYYDLLSAAASSLDVWETEYLQQLEGDDAVLEWVKGTGLRPILNGLPDDERQQFLDAYSARLRAAYPMRDDGRTLYPFRRLFLVAIKAAS